MIPITILGVYQTHSTGNKIRKEKIQKGNLYMKRRERSKVSSKLRHALLWKSQFIINKVREDNEEFD